MPANPGRDAASSVVLVRERLDAATGGAVAAGAPRSSPTRRSHGQRPAHWASCCPHSRHDRTVRTLPTARTLAATV